MNLGTGTSMAGAGYQSLGLRCLLDKSCQMRNRLALLVSNCHSISSVRLEVSTGPGSVLSCLSSCLHDGTMRDFLPIDLIFVPPNWMRILDRQDQYANQSPHCKAIDKASQA